MKREQKVIECNNAGTFFNLINNKLSYKRGLGASNNDNGDFITYDGDRANPLIILPQCVQATTVLYLTSNVLYLKTQSWTLSSLPTISTLPLEKLRISGASRPDDPPPPPPDCARH